MNLMENHVPAEQDPGYKEIFYINAAKVRQELSSDIDLGSGEVCAEGTYLSSIEQVAHS
jgi:hypothetical protein